MTSYVPLPFAATWRESEKTLRVQPARRAGALSRRPVLAALLAVIFLAGCGDEVAAPETSKELPGQAAKSHTIADTPWLAPYNNTPPELWMASREAGYDLAMDDPAVDAMRERLEVARKTFGTPYRMTANRAVQLEAMVAEEGWKPESAADLIITLSEVGSLETGREGFGQACQAYFILRKQGQSREQALQSLREENNRS
ncbi:hypothetical protein V6C03_08585 [Methyloligella sp. 2.7D]|uniref:hypothetical protein n=1 Tax=unclassified Methyloligella TaxID=2625955 RepID=UPI00157C5020|nr:hypothetical protein [Methyloligella sp. GL2]QKP78074.1 hypothetical protein HT051_11865 [Methyloligella sp. GL2]